MAADRQIALVHDYLSQRGGAERVVLALTRTFPGAPLYTSFYEPATTFPEFAAVNVEALPINHLAPLRRRHRLALPLLAPSFSRLRIDADVVICSSSGWAHGARVSGRKVVYCHTPARWLYQNERYLGATGTVARMARATLHRPLERWDRKAAAAADRYLANSRWIAGQIKRIYGIEAELVHPPVSIDLAGERRPVDGVEPGYVLCVSRLLPYKNVEAVVTAAGLLPDERLVVVGDGPERARLQSVAPANVILTGTVGDAELRWLYENACCLVAASYEDFGLTPVEAAAFGRPTAALRYGGFLDTIRAGETGVLFDRPEPGAIAAALTELIALTWNGDELRRHADSFSEVRFACRMQEIAAEELRAGGIRA
jgi:glycosyltransferase involved in cell wall biosynthesis